ncbi:Bestrophin-like protein [Aphelenchoides fujianensis]|nr:Bestrophin-like protein [Aphelenchoides fujianensis]
MTVPYAKEAATATFYNFAKLMVKWKGSVWKLVMFEALIWSALYWSIQATYFFWIRNTEYNETFEMLVQYMKKNESATFVTILLGFFTSITIERWWACYDLMVWPDGLASVLATYLRECTETIPIDEMKRLRKTMARYIILSYIFLMRDICEPVKRRFPDWKDVGIMTAEEETYITDMIASGHTGAKYAVPLYWILWMLKERFQEEDKTKTPKSAMEEFEHHHVVVEIVTFRGRLGDVMNFDFVPNPILAYTQACILAVYLYAVQQLFSRQVLYSEGDVHAYNLAYIFLLTLSQVIWFLGWYKAAQVMINPFGYDEDDFEVLWLIDRHWAVVKKILVDPSADLPSTLNSEQAEHAGPTELLLPHTVASVGAVLLDGKYRTAVVQGSMANLQLPEASEREQVVFPGQEQITGV